MSLGRGSWLGSPGLVSPGRLFFFSLDVGGWRLDCDHPGLTLAPSSNNESATAKKRYERVNLIINRLPTTKSEEGRYPALGRLPVKRYGLRCVSGGLMRGR